MALLVQPSRFLHYNAGAFSSRGEACLVDPGITEDEVAALVDRLAGSDIRYVVLTHADWDHVLGPEHVPATTIVAQAAYPDDLDPAAVRVWLSRLERRAGVAREGPFEPPLPDVTFADETTLAVGELELRLEHAPGHAASMLTVYDGASGELWASDTLSDVEIPLVAHDLAAYESTLARLAELDIRTLVPGHGNATGDRAEVARRLDEDRRYLAELRTAVETAIATGSSLDETVAACAGIALRRGPEDETLHRLNVEKAYADLGGDADPEEVGYARAWKEATGT